MSARRWLVAGLVAIAATGFVLSPFVQKQRRPAAARPVPPGSQSARACAACHSNIAQEFLASGMARSFYRAAPAAMPPGFANRQKFYHQPSDRYYELRESGGSFFQRRHQLGPAGQEINIFERQIHFVVGSGNHARTFLHQAPDGRLYELPLAWYAEGGGSWAMNPGYDHPNHQDFRREIPHECIGCHTAYPAVPESSAGFGGDPVFPRDLPEGIDCRRCHGPGDAHMAAARRGDEKALRAAIVNPARLPPELQLDICMQCHLETTSAPLPHSIVRWDRGAFSFRPGEPLGEYAVHFDHAPGRGLDDKFEIASHAYRLRKSACFLKSGGKLTCTTCHDPHAKATPARALEACRDCHAASLAARGNHPPAPDCALCHMPKRRTEDVVHVVMTDHLIQRRPPAGELLAMRKERPDTAGSAYRGPVVLYYPDPQSAGKSSDLYLAVAQVKQYSNLTEGTASLSRLLARRPDAPAPAHLELADALAHSGDLAQAIPHFEEALRKAPDLRPALLGLVQTLTKLSRFDRARRLVQQRLEKAPDDAAAWNALGLILVQTNSLPEAIQAFRKSTSLQPEYVEALHNCAAALLQTGDRGASEAMFREAIRLDPGFARSHLELAGLVSDFAEAEYHFRKAILHDPNPAPAHFRYGAALAGEQRYSEAAREFESAIASDPQLAEAYVGLGDMLALDGKSAPAAAQYRRALQLKPNLEPARVGLQMTAPAMR